MRAPILGLALAHLPEPVPFPESDELRNAVIALNYRTRWGLTELTSLSIRELVAWLRSLHKFYRSEAD